MVLELQPGSLPDGGGLVKYGPEFAVWSTAEPGIVANPAPGSEP
jgi:hypothetical protein